MNSNFNSIFFYFFQHFGIFTDATNKSENKSNIEANAMKKIHQYIATSRKTTFYGSLLTMQRHFIALIMYCETG